MHFQLSGELKEFINNCVKSGNFGSQAEVMRAALRRMKRQEENRRMQIIEREPNETTLKALKELEDGDYTVSTYEEFKQELESLNQSDD